MKNHLLLLFIGIILISCSNDNDDSTGKGIIGNWNWIESSGGINGRTETPTSTGNEIKLEISNSIVKKYLNGNMISELNYSIELEEYNGEQRQIIVYENQYSQVISLNGNHLILQDRCADCFQNEYTRE